MFHLAPPEYTTVDDKVTEGNVDAQYIYKQYDVSGVESYKTKLLKTFTHSLTHQI